eukprot:m51a1_g5152 hypothetical protein (870) ;mRNA; r:66754-69890
MGSTNRSGIEPLFVTQPSQEIFKVRPDVDLTAEHPQRLVSKKDLLEDIERRGIISDFYPIRDKIKGFEGTDLLLVYDAAQTYGKNFYVCTAQEAIEEELQRAALRRQRELLEKRREEERGQMRTGPWVSWGSESEVLQTAVVVNRPLLRFEVGRVRREFGAPYRFGDSDVGEGVQECPPFKNPRAEIKLLELDRAIQAVPTFSERSQQTNWYRTVSSTQNTDPLEMVEEEKKVALLAKDLHEFLSRVLPLMEQSLEQNDMFDVVGDGSLSYADDDIAFGNKFENQLKEIQTFTDHSPNVMVSAVDWFCGGGRTLAGVALADSRPLSERMETAGRDTTNTILIWGMSDTMSPQHTLLCPSSPTSFRFHPDNVYLLVAGCSNGRILLFDMNTRRPHIASAARGMAALKLSNAVAAAQQHEVIAAPQPTGSAHARKVTGPQSWDAASASSVAESHKAAVAAVEWLPLMAHVTPAGTLESVSGGPYQFISIAGDGVLCFWDIRQAHLKTQKHGPAEWSPALRVVLDQAPPPMPQGVECALARIATSSVAPPLNFLFGTESGQVLSAKFTGGTKLEAVDLTVPGVHHGPIAAVQWSPQFPETLFLTAGDWSLNVCHVGIREPLVRSPFMSSHIGCVRWSPTRAAVFFVGRSDGSVDIWDLLDKSSGPCFTQVVASTPITSVYFLKPPKDPSGAQLPQQFVAVGDAAGIVHVLEVPRNFARAMASEAKHMAQFVDREVERVSFVQEAAAAAAAAAAVTAAAAAAALHALEKTETSAALQAARASYSRLVLTARTNSARSVAMSTLGVPVRGAMKSPGAEVRSSQLQLLSVPESAPVVIPPAEPTPEEKEALEVDALDKEYAALESTLLQTQKPAK